MYSGMVHALCHLNLCPQVKYKINLIHFPEVLGQPNLKEKVKLKKQGFCLGLLKEMRNGFKCCLAFIHPNWPVLSCFFIFLHVCCEEGKWNLQK